MGASESLKRGFDLAAESVTKGVDFSASNWKTVLTYFLAGILAASLGTGIGLALALVSGHFLEGPLGQAGAIAVAIALFAIPFFIGLVYSCAAYLGAVEYIFLNRSVGYFEGRNVVSALKWSLFILSIILVMALAFGGAFFISLGNMMAWTVLFLLGYLLILIGSIVARFIAYYSIYQISVRKMGPIEAIFSSYGLIKANFWETIVFLVIMWVVQSALGLPIGILFVVFYVLGLLAFALSPIAGVAVFAIAFLIVAAGSLLAQSIMLPMHVFFYKAIIEGRGRKGNSPEAKAAPKGGVETLKKKPPLKKSQAA